MWLLLLLLLNVFVNAPLCRRMTGESWGQNSHVISYWTLFCRDECGGMFWLALHEVYAICNLCIFGKFYSFTLSRSHDLTVIRLHMECIYHCFNLCILQRIWRGRLPGAGFISGALTTLVIPSRDCPRLVCFDVVYFILCHAMSFVW